MGIRDISSIRTMLVVGKQYDDVFVFVFITNSSTKTKHFDASMNIGCRAFGGYWDVFVASSHA